MRWTAIAAPMNVTDNVHKFTGRFRLASVQIEWSADAPNVRSVIGRERNGVFFDD